MSPVSADEARAILARIGVLATEDRVEEVSAADLDGRVVASSAFLVSQDLPDFPRAMMDGYAVRSADAGARLLRGHAQIGAPWPHNLEPGECVAVPTGGVVPHGADAVVMIEHTTLDADWVTLRKPVDAGQHVMNTGDDFRRGTTLVSGGRRLRVAEIAALTALGALHCTVFRRPRVGILSTGNELVAPFAEPAPGQVRDVNGTVLTALVRRAGGEPVAGGIAGDDPADLAANIAYLAARSDLILLSGGSSVGTRDLTAEVLGVLGAEIAFHGIQVRPGKPTLFATLDGTPIFGLPGVPVSAMIIFEVFVRPVIARLGGQTDPPPDDWPRRRSARLTRAIPSVVGREDYVRVSLTPQGAASPVIGGTAALSGLLLADGWVIVPAEREALDVGALVEVVSS